MVDLRRDGDALLVSLHDIDRGGPERCAADVVIFCTGYRSRVPDYLEPLRGRVTNTDGTFEVNEDYSLRWDGPDGLRLFVQNFAEGTHGIADPNLSLSSWRSARILNAVLGRDQYRVDQATSTMSWQLD